MEQNDVKQKAVTKCLAAGKLNLSDPYSGSYYWQASRSVERDDYRRECSRKKRVDEFHDSSPTRERYDADERFDRGGINSDDPAKRAETRELMQLTLAALDRLPSESRLTIMATDLADRSAASVARERGETASTVRSKRYHAIERLRSEVGLL